MKILAIDPGDQKSGFCLMDDYKPVRFGKTENFMLLSLIMHSDMDFDVAVIECVASYGKAVGANVFDTCIWIGRFWEAVRENREGVEVKTVYRLDEKMAICHDSRAKDTNIRRALIDRFAVFDKKNGKGQKNHKDTFYGFKADVWSAFAVGVTWLDRQKEGKRAKGS